jgi:hypothetical protein
MKLQISTPKQSINKAYLKEKISRNDIERISRTTNSVVMTPGSFKKALLLQIVLVFQLVTHCVTNSVIRKF